MKFYDVMMSLGKRMLSGHVRTATTRRHIYIVSSRRCEPTITIICLRKFINAKLIIADTCTIG